MDFISKNWLAIISLLVALIGGIPGFIAIINQRKNRPIFSFSPVYQASGQILHRPSGNLHSMVFLSGTASNEGTSPLSPAWFDLECKKADGSWQRFERHLIPEDIQLNSDVLEIQVETAWQKDLQRFSDKIKTGVPLNGHLMFISPNLTLDEISNNHEFKLICRDIFGKEHKTSVETNLYETNAEGVLPKHGLIFKSKT